MSWIVILEVVVKTIMIVKYQPVSAENRSAAHEHLEEILQILSKVGGFSKLSPVQRKFLMGLVLAAIIPADKRIRNIELEKLQIILRRNLQITESVAMESLAMAEAPPDEIIPVEILAKALPDLLGIEDRCTIITYLWELALCDDELHSFEEQLVYKVADISGVPRKKVAEIMARVAARS